MNGPQIGAQRFPHCHHCRRTERYGCPEERGLLLHIIGCPEDPTCPGAVPVPDESETT